MVDKFIKNINLQNVVNKEVETYKRSVKNLAKPLNLLDETTSLLVITIRTALTMYKSSNAKLEKDFLTVYLNIANAALHLIRSSRLNLLKGYYGSVLVLNRALQNYLYTLMYVHYEPQDCEILLKEERDTFKNDKLYKNKFHETNLRNYLKAKGHDIPEEALQVFAKFTHGSIFSSQIFGYKPLWDSQEGEYDVLYAPEYDVTKAIHLMQLLIVSPLDFSFFFIRHFGDNTKKWKILRRKWEESNKRVDSAIHAMDQQYQYFKTSPPEVLKNFFTSQGEKESEEK